MKSKIKKHFPYIFNILKKVYRWAVKYEVKNSKQETINQAARLYKNTKEIEIIFSVFSDQYVVHNGHFKGIKYIKRSSGSALLPKIFGSYEEPIQGWVQEVIEIKKYHRILDIGCAEGYYACGFAMRMPDTEVIGYDIDMEARNNALELIKINGLNNIAIKSECTHEELNSKSNSGSLIFCDIEGFEIDLLDPIKVPNLKYVDIIVESHDWLIPNVTEVLISRFCMTHTMRIVIDYPYRLMNYKTPNVCTADQYDFIINESRPPRMKFIYLESVYGKV